MNIYIFCAIFFVIPGAYFVNISYLQDTGIFAFVCAFMLLFLYKYRNNEKLQEFLYKWL